MKRKQYSLKVREWLITKKSFSLVEVILAGSIFILIVTALVGAFLYGQEAISLAGQRNRASFLAEEALEATRNIRDEKFSNLTDGIHGLATTGNQWVFSGTEDIIDNIFKRQVAINSVDSKRKDITTTVSWKQNQQRSGLISIVTRFTDWQRRVGWTVPVLDSSFDLSGTADAIAISLISNNLYLSRATSNTSEFYIFDVSSSTPIPLSELNLVGSPNDLVATDNYVYIASSDNNSELQVIDVTQKNNPNLSYVVNLPGNSDAISIASFDNYLYLGRANNNTSWFFYIFDLNDPAKPNLIGQFNGSGSGAPVPNDILILGNYAYIASNDNSRELQIIDIQNKSLPVKIGELNLNSGNDGADALSLAPTNDPDYILLGRTASTAPELYSINISDPFNPILSSSLEIGANILNISSDAVQGFAFLATNATASDFKVIDASTPATLALPPVSQLNLADSPKDLVYSQTLDKVFIASSSNTQELQVVGQQ